jgi:uncharacterized protein YoaH (UPF0181 family)
MSNDKEPPREDFPIDCEMVGIGPDHQFSIRTRLAKLRQLRIDAERGDVRAIDELLKTALLFSERVDFKNETSPDRIVLASLRNVLKYLLVEKKGSLNEKAKLAAFDITRRRGNQPNKIERKYRDQGIAEVIEENKAMGMSSGEATEDAAHTYSVSERVAERASEKYRDEAKLKVEVKKILMSDRGQKK